MQPQFEIRKATNDDSGLLIELLKNTHQEGKIHLNFEREPNYFHATMVSTNLPEVWVMEDNHNRKLAAVFSIGKRQVYINGAKHWVRYGNDLRIHSEYQGGRTLYRLFKKYRELMQSDWMQTVILEDNNASISTVSSGRLILPAYYKYGKIVTHIIDIKKNITPLSGNTIRRANSEDVVMIQAFFNEHAPTKQFYPHYNFSKIGTRDPYYKDIKIENIFLSFKEGMLQGMCGIWDQKKFKQTRFMGYAGAMKVLRHINNLAKKILGGIYLPKPGEKANYVLLHSLLCESNDGHVFLGLLAAIQQAYSDSQYDAISLGLDERDPLNYFCGDLKGIRLKSNHYLASYESDPTKGLDASLLFYPEIARL